MAESPSFPRLCGFLLGEYAAVPGATHGAGHWLFAVWGREAQGHCAPLVHLRDASSVPHSVAVKRVPSGGAPCRRLPINRRCRQEDKAFFLPFPWVSEESLSKHLMLESIREHLRDCWA